MQTINNQNIINRIEQLGGQYDPDSYLTIDDQLMICEILAESTPIHPYYKKDITNENVSVNGVINGSCKQTVNFEITQNKLQIVDLLKTLSPLYPEIGIKTASSAL